MHPAAVVATCIPAERAVTHQRATRVIVHPAAVLNGHVSVERAVSHGRAGSLVPHPGAVVGQPIGDEKTAQDRVRPLAAVAGDHAAAAARVNDGIGHDCWVGRIGAADGNRLAEEVDVLQVSAGGNDDFIAVNCGVDARLDRELVSGDVDAVGRGYRCR